MWKIRITIISLIIILVIIFIAISIFIIILNSRQNNEQKSEFPLESYIDMEMKYPYTGEIQPVTDDNTFYVVENCINKYLFYASSYGIDTDTEKKQAIYNVLDKDFINENNITLDNVYNYVEHATKDMIFKAVKMNMLQDAVADIEGYSVYGKIKNAANGTTSYQYFIVKLDTYQNVFCIYPLKSQDYKDINDITVKNDTTEIIQNVKNTFDSLNLSEDDMANKYFQNYKELMLDDPESAYNVLDNDYKQKRFGTLEDYKKYIQDNSEKLKSINMSGYTVDYYYAPDYTVYTCKDQDGNTYTFKVTAVMQYSLILNRNLRKLNIGVGI